LINKKHSRPSSGTSDAIYSWWSPELIDMLAQFRPKSSEAAHERWRYHV